MYISEGVININKLLTLSPAPTVSPVVSLCSYLMHRDARQTLIEHGNIEFGAC